MSKFESTHQNSLLDEVIEAKLKCLGFNVGDQNSTSVNSTLVDEILSYRQKSTKHLSPIESRVQSFINKYFEGEEINLPNKTLFLDQTGLARESSLPKGEDFYKSEDVTSYRLPNGVLNNPKKDRRTTKGTFHIADAGLPITHDKKVVPLETYGKLLKSAFNPPESYMTLPFTANLDPAPKMWAGLMLRPLVKPKLSSLVTEKSMEVLFLTPATHVSNLDFVESIFQNAGNPNKFENDASLDHEHWNGVTGCVVLATHLTQLKKKDLGLPNIKDANERQIRDGMCWESEDELYNDGQAFKITLRDASGTMLTVIADNYYGYCKKEVKTQIGFSANLCGQSEEEHSGGAVAYPTYHLGEILDPENKILKTGHSYSKTLELLGDQAEAQKAGYAIDKSFNDIIYINETAKIDLRSQVVTWDKESLKLDPNKTYVYPNGYKVKMDCSAAGIWRLVGTVATGTFCHKPCTVSGGGKSEISKSISDAVMTGPVFVSDFESDMEWVQKIFDKDFSYRYKNHSTEYQGTSRPVLSPERSLGSVIKLFTTNENHTEEYTQFLQDVPKHIWPLVFAVKRWYQPEWGNDWKKHFQVDEIDGSTGHELKLEDRRLNATKLRIGYNLSEKWRTFKLRQDFMPSYKVQVEDDISASTLDTIKTKDGKKKVVKVVKNCEHRFFQRPDEAIHRGYDKQTEIDMSSDSLFVSNYHPIDQKELDALTKDTIGLYEYTDPMRDHLKQAQENGDTYVVSSAIPRIVDGKSTKNPRYLQLSPAYTHKKEAYIAEIGERLVDGISINADWYKPVDAVLMGRRNNIASEGIRPLAVYSPIHYQEFPELFMDLISSLTGKSPSTTGAGSEGALTKGPFNALRTIVDLNNALVSFILTDSKGFTTSAGHIGPEFRVDHDISLLIPELWSRMSLEERDPKFMLENGYIEAIPDMKDKNGDLVQSSRLGYRVTPAFAQTFLGRIFNQPANVLPENMLRPELQCLEEFCDGVRNVTEAHQRVASQYIQDGSAEDACPPLKALLYIMAEGNYNGLTEKSPEFRKLFDRDEVLKSEWYQKRLETQVKVDQFFLEKQASLIEARLEEVEANPEIEAAQTAIKSKLSALKSISPKDLEGQLGADAYLWSSHI